MKITALNFGLPDKTTSGYLREAVTAAEATGAEVTVIEMSDKHIGRCIGCGACSGGVEKVKTNAPFCVIKDDLRAVAEMLLDADGILVAAPVCYLGPTGQFLDFIHRFCVAADKSVMELRQYQRERRGQPFLDPRFLKQQWVGLISVGEGLDDYGVSFGLANMTLCTFSTNMKLVGGVDICGEMTPERTADFKAQCRDLGTALTASIHAPESKVAYVGKMGHCPVCHGDTFSLIPGTKRAECPVCGITGALSLQDGEVVVYYTEDETFHSRLNHGGIIDHCVELHGNDEFCMEFFGDQTWVTPRNFMEEVKGWIAEGLMEAPPGFGGMA